MAESKRLQTRLLLKYDTYANWTTNDPILLAGELAVATIASGDTQKVNSVTAPQVLIKVGDGSSKYTELPFASGLAADVYGWAKASVKPSYTASEIGGLSEYITTVGDTNSEYKFAVVDAATYKYKLQKRDYANGAWSEWADFEGNGLDLSAIDTRLDAVEAQADANKIAIETLNKGADQAGSVANSIKTAIENLDAEKSQTAGTDGLALSVTQENGVITGISGSIAANTYDAYGSAAAVDGKLTEYKTTNDAAVKANADAIDAEVKARKAAIEALDFAGVTGSQEGTTVSFVSSVSEIDGVIDATLGELKLNSAYKAEGDDKNLIATMADVKAQVADLAGAMHFEGAVENLPSDVSGYVNGDVIIVTSTKKEYVFSNGTFVELGNEDMGLQAVQALDVADITVGADSTLTLIGQTDGAIHATATKIQIAMDQVTGLSDAINNGGDKDDEQDDRLDAVEKKADDNAKAIAAEAEARKTAIEALDKADEAIAGQYVSAVSETDGVITVSRAALPTLSLTEGIATTPTAASVSVVADIDVNGHTITDTRVNVATTAGITAAIGALDADFDVSDSKKVMTGVTQVDGVLTKIDEVTLSNIAFTGNVNDLVQTSGEYIVFDCGSSTKNI